MIAEWPQRIRQFFKRQLRKPRHPLSHALRLVGMAVAVLWLVEHVLLGPSGIMALQAKRTQYRQELARVHALEDRNRTLNQSVKALQSNPAAIEGIAREQLHLTRPGEVVYTYPPALTAAPAAREASNRP